MVSARRQWALSANSGAHESRLLKSSSSNSLPCLCLTINFRVWRSGAYHLYLVSSWTWLVQALVMWVPPWPWGLLLKDLWAGSIILHHYDCFLLPFLNLVHVFCTVRPSGKVPSYVCKACTITLHILPKYAFTVFTGITREEKVSNVLLSEYTLMGCPLSVSYPFLLAISHFHWCHSPNCQEVCCPCIHPWCCQGIHLHLFHYINYSANSGSSQDDRYSGCKIGKVQDDQGYLILIVAPKFHPPLTWITT